MSKGLANDSGDEYFTSNVLSNYSNIFFVNDYVFRCWTGTTRLVPSEKQLDSIVMLHVPAEKQYGMLKLFKKYLKHNGGVDKITAFKFLHIYHPSFLTVIKKILKRILKWKS